MPTAVLINDTSLFNPHFGCQLVGQTIREQLARVGMQLSASFPLEFDSKLAKRYMDAADLVIVNGEGSIHHGRNLGLLELADQYPCALINCVYQENGLQRSLQNFKYVSARESFSASDIRNQGVQCEVVPDVIFASMLLRSMPKSHPEIPMGLTDNVVNPLSGFSPKTPLVHDSLKNLVRCRTICAGRFHAAIAAAVLRIPFTTWSSNTWKTESMMIDMGIEHLHFESQAEAVCNMPSEFSERIDAYVQKAQQSIGNMFDTLAMIAEPASVSRAA